MTTSVIVLSGTGDVIGGGTRKIAEVVWVSHKRYDVIVTWTTLVTVYWRQEKRFGG